MNLLQSVSQRTRGRRRGVLLFSRVRVRSRRALGVRAGARGSRRTRCLRDPTSRRWSVEQDPAGQAIHEAVAGAEVTRALGEVGRCGGNAQSAVRIQVRIAERQQSGSGCSALDRQHTFLVSGQHHSGPTGGHDGDQLATERSPGSFGRYGAIPAAATPARPPSPPCRPARRAFRRR